MTDLDRLEWAVSQYAGSHNVWRPTRELVVLAVARRVAEPIPLHVENLVVSQCEGDVVLEAYRQWLISEDVDE